MAAATRSPPPPTASPSSPLSAQPGPGSAPVPPARRKPLPLHDLPQLPTQTFNFDWDSAVKPLPTVPGLPGSVPLESPRLRQPPISPVRVNVQPENWAKPSNANIVNSHDDLPPLPSHHLIERDLPRTPDAPTPPPRSPANTTKQHHHFHHPRTGTMPEKSVRMITAPAPDHHHARPTTASRAEAVSPSSPSKPAPVHAAPPSGPLPSPVSKSLPAEPLEADDASSTLPPRRTHDENRDSRETESTASTVQTPQQASTGSSVVTSASSVSGTNEVAESKDDARDLDASPESSILEAPIQSEPVPQLQYHHSQFIPRTASLVKGDQRMASTPDLLEGSGSINRHLTPNQFMRRSSLPRPQSSYSAYSDFSPRGRSPNPYGGSHNRAPSSSRMSPDVRPSSYVDMLNVPYPQPAPAPITLDNSQLRNAVGNNASLLSTQKTLEMYRQNVKKTNDLSIQYSFAIFLISTAQEQGFDPAAEEPPTPRRKGSPKAGRDSPYLESSASSPHELVREAKSILQKLASSGYPFAQYYLADGYASGLFSKGKEDYNAAFPLFVLAAKHGHAESAYRTGLCYEFGWGCRKDPAKAVQFLRTAASKRHPGAMTRLGKACLSGDLGEKRYREGIKWLKLATESADAQYNAAPYHLGCLYEMGYGDDIFKDESYAAELFTQAADLGHPDANFRMGEAYEHGMLNCPRDPALSVHFYTGAAERGHPGAMMGLCAWYMVGAEPILEKDEEEAYEWAHRAAELGNVKAQYAVGYFTEMGIGCRRDPLEANVWYVQAADAGDERAKQRLAAIRAAVSGGTPMEVAPPRNGKIKKGAEKDESCVVM